MSLRGYSALLDWTGRATRVGARGVLSGPPPALLLDHGMNPDAWVKLMKSGRLSNLGALGRPEALAANAARDDKAWRHGARPMRVLHQNA